MTKKGFYSCRFLNPAWHWFGLISGLVFVIGGLCLMMGSRLSIIGYLWVLDVVVFGAFFTVHCVRLLWSHKTLAQLKVIRWYARRIGWCCSAIRIAWRETSFKMGVIFCTLGITVGLFVGLGMTKLVVLIAVALLGWGLEIANCSIETLLDIVHPDYSPKVKVVKDAFSAVPIFTYSAYAICWLILVAPTLYERIIK